MRALLAFTGSRGDAQPGILLARELRARGHAVTLALSPNLVGFAREHGVAAVEFGCDSAELLATQHADRRFRSPSPRQRLRAVLDLQRRGVAEAVRDLLALTPGHDVLVTGMAGEEAAEKAARRVGVPLAAVHFFPIQPNRSVPVVPADWGPRIPGGLNRRIWSGLRWARDAALARPLAEFGVVEHPLPGRVSIQAYDIELFPGLAAELPPRHPVTGFAVDADGFLSSPTEATLTTWLDAGPAPIYVGFGSMTVDDPAELVRVLRTVCARRGRRLLLAAGWAGIEPELTAEVAIVEQVDHAAVFPRCVAAVHHGGAGTTAAALRAGVPQVICSVQADQPYWGQALTRLGLAVTRRAAGLDADALDALLDRVADPAVVERAAAYAREFPTGGVARAADEVEALVPVSFPTPVLDHAGRPQ
ncbi:putative glycosyltransferase [Nocardia neocaledoniensis NBRC 108232]|uniref:UDP:flavonoid glycosyltransferase YjiC (YdhE family) n=1 Tax=Nocardia neocaledoniensis TaxID=236511 RepID=A0A317NFX7_9NOCA|nr:glycosyltransferase [Nocardia neocaledoniensis]PWV74286.1 UDP:flavonoid glycosyltransferase YjiC (YdhE family) [Nocardia neocaledoniensis]GEM34915.1 putative glycosyltransferase [Nocardia neocaledoniensis NBRC 108232]